eukprot:6788014-Ditylum_brightwellii.AAC.1
MPHAVELSACIGVAGCSCPISCNVVLTAAASFAFTKSAPSLASAADATTFFNIVEIMSTAPLCRLSI